MKKKGFTLIEMTAVLAILVILIGLGYDFLINNTKSLVKEKNKSYVETQLKSFSDFLVSSMQLAYQETIKVSTINNIDHLEFIIPITNTQLYYDKDTSNGIKYELFKESNSLKIESKNFKNNTTLTKLLFQNNLIDFKVIKDLKLIQINITVKDTLTNQNKTYTINYKIRN